MTLPDDPAQVARDAIRTLGEEIARTETYLGELKANKAAHEKALLWHIDNAGNALPEYK